MNRKIVVAIILSGIIAISNAQVPEKISYQAVIRSSEGTALANASVHLRVSFINGISENIYYSEEHTVESNAQGVVSMELGTGSQTTGSFSSIDWASGNVKLKIEYNNGTTWTEIGLNNLLSVPYALFAASGINGENGVGISGAMLNPDSTLVFNFTDGSSYTTPIPVVGSKGDTGVGIENVTLNSDSTLLITFTDGNSYTTPIPIVGRVGAAGPQGIPGINGNGISSIVSNEDGTLTINFTDGSTTNTISLIGPKGDKGDTGDSGISINWLGSFAGSPENPNLNDAYYNSLEGKSYVWDGILWQVIAKDGGIGPLGPQGPQGEIGNPGPQGPQGPEGPAGVGLVFKGNWSSDSTYYPGYYVFNESTDNPSINSMWICQNTVGPTLVKPKDDLNYWVEFEAPAGEDGLSIVWLGELSEAPVSPSINQAYYNLTDKKSYVWNGSVWSILAIDGEQGPEGPLVNGTNGQTLVNNGTTWEASSLLFHDRTNFRIGINSTSPTNTLDVNGTLRLRGLMYDNLNLAGTTGQVLTRDATGVSWQNSLGNITGSGATGKMAIWSGSSTLTQLPNLSFVSSLEVVGNPTTNPDDPIFEVKNSAGEVIFGVYQEGVRINIKDDVLTKGVKGGFAVGGLTNQTKGTVEYFRITPDSARVYVKENATAKGVKGGFAVGGLTNQTKSVLTRDLLFIAPDSARIYVDETTSKGVKGGFAVGGLTNQTKTGSSNFMQLTPDNYFIGHQSGSNTTTGLYNSFFGYQAGMSNSEGNYNSFVGYKAGLSTTTGSSNVFIGYECGKANTTGYSNVVIGKSSAVSANGNNNIVIGEYAGYSLTSGIHNTLIGSSAGYSHTNQDYNVMIGTNAGYHINASGWSGSFNTFMGINAGYKIAISRDNTFIGTNAGYWIENGQRNTFVGIDAGRSGSEHNEGYTANDNTFLGCKSGYMMLNGTTNVFLGTQSGFNNQNGSGNVFIGYMSGYSETGSNKLYISNTYVNPPLIYGDFSSKKLGINTTTLTSTLNVGGNITASGSINATTVNANVTGNITGNVTGDVTGNIAGKVNNITMASFTLSANGEVVSIPSLDFRLVYSVDDGTITLLNDNSTQNCSYRIIKQTSSIDGEIDVVLALTKQVLMKFEHDGEGCELHFCDEEETANCSVWLTYIHGKIIGHYVMF